MDENYYADFSQAPLNVPEAEPEPLTASEELQAVVTETLKKLQGRSFSQRHPELGKMVNCQVCKTRHRTSERKCEQVFTYRVGDYELYRRDAKGDLVPDYRTSMRPDEKPTKRQVVGTAAFKGKRLRPHPSKFNLQLVQRTRSIFLGFGYSVEDKIPTEKAELEKFEKDLKRARVLAARQIRRERELSDREIRRRQDQSRRINQGLL